MLLLFLSFLKILFGVYQALLLLLLLLLTLLIGAQISSSFLNAVPVFLPALLHAALFSVKSNNNPRNRSNNT
uniref:Putative secreted peptide n=1 Tax=Anopheles braziliensis TaxID=58242 RepID=A0A2M3ZMB5_9DIPT